MTKPLDTAAKASAIKGLNDRSREVLKHIVDAYVDTGAPVGSRTLSRSLGLGLSPATIRNVMADLEDLGLLFAPHTSAGRLTQDERAHIESQVAGDGRSLAEVLEEASETISGLSRCAGLVVAPKLGDPLKHIEFVSLGPGRALVVLISVSGVVENRIIDVPAGLPASSLVEASNYLSARLTGRTLEEAHSDILKELEQQRAELDQLTSRIIERGLASWGGSSGGRSGALILRGQSQLLEDVNALEDLERIRQLFTLLETKDSLIRLLDLTGSAEGVQIFIGAENELFGLAGCSMIIAPYSNSQQKVVGAIGVIGPTRIDYARIIPMVDYTAKVIGRLVG